jgi:glycosyltransferase involved in cell wall biosynthesis
LRVLLATPSYFPIVGGSESLTRALATELNGSGIRTDILAFNMDKKWHPKWRQKVESEGRVNIFKVAALNPFSVLSLQPLYPSLGVIVLPKPDFRKRLVDYDVIHFVGEADLSMPFFSRSVRKPKIMQCFGPPIVDSQLQRHRTMRKLFVRIFPTLADLYITFTLNEKRVLSEWGVAPNRIRIWHYGVDTGFFKPDETKRLDNLVLFVGRIESYKGLHVLLRSLQLLKTKAQLVLIGPASNPEYFRQIQRMCLEINSQGVHTVEYMGSMGQSNLLLWYQKAAVLARPDLVGTSGEGCSTLEALACGTPVIGVQNHVVRNDVNGLIIEPNNPEKLAEALEKVLGNKKLREQYGKAGRKIIEQEFSLKSSVKELTNIYEDVLDSRFA